MKVLDPSGLMPCALAPARAQKVEPAKVERGPEAMSDGHNRLAIGRIARGRS